MTEKDKPASQDGGDQDAMNPKQPSQAELDAEMAKNKQGQEQKPSDPGFTG